MKNLRKKGVDLIGQIMFFEYMYIILTYKLLNPYLCEKKRYQHLCVFVSTCICGYDST